MHSILPEKENKLISKINFYLNIPLVLIYLPLFYIFNNGNGVFDSKLSFLGGIIVFVIYFLILLFIKGDKKIIISNALLELTLLYELGIGVYFSVFMIHSETLSTEEIVLVYYILCCLILNFINLIFICIVEIYKRLHKCKKIGE